MELMSLLNKYQHTTTMLHWNKRNIIILCLYLFMTLALGPQLLSYVCQAKVEYSIWYARPIFFQSFASKFQVFENGQTVDVGVSVIATLAEKSDQNSSFFIATIFEGATADLVVWKWARDQYYKTNFTVTQFTVRFWCIIWGATWCQTQYLFVAAIKSAL